MSRSATLSISAAGRPAVPAFARLEKLIRDVQRGEHCDGEGIGERVAAFHLLDARLHVRGQPCEVLGAFTRTG